MSATHPRIEDSWFMRLVERCDREGIPYEEMCLCEHTIGMHDDYSWDIPSQIGQCRPCQHKCILYVPVSKRLSDIQNLENNLYRFYEKR